MYLNNQAPMTVSQNNNHQLQTELGTFVEKPTDWLETALKEPREEGFIESDGCKIHYFRWGKPSNPPLVLLHGFLSHARCFAFIAPFLAKDFHIVAYDFSGMGDSGVREQYSDATRVTELLETVDKTGLFDHQHKPIIISHSYGGRIALEAITQHPDKFAGLIVCDLMIIRPEILIANKEQFQAPGNQDPNRPNRIYPDLESAKKRFVLAPPQKVEEPQLFNYMAYHSLKEVDGGCTWKFDPSVYNTSADDLEKWTRFGKLLVAAPGNKAVVYGAESLLFNADSADYVREIGGFDFPIIEIANARHHLMLDQPIAFVSVLKTILSTWAVNNGFSEK